MTKKAAAIYVELDCLLDTRLAVLEGMDKEKVIDIIDGGYHTRREDWWDGIDMEEYRRRYKERTIYTLSQSTVTGCVALIQKVAFELASDLPESPTHNKIEVHINTYPYRLSEEECLGIEAALTQWVSAPISYQFLYLSPEQLTVGLVNTKYTVLIMYDYSSWLDMHLKEFQNCFLHDVTLFAPKINLNRTPDEEMLKALRELGMEGVKDEFDLYEKLAMVFIQLMLIEPMYFSILRPDFPMLYEKEPNFSRFDKEKK
jgi:hypothetical protein